MKYTYGNPTAAGKYTYSPVSDSDYSWANNYLKEEKKRKQQQKQEEMARQSEQFKKDSSVTRNFFSADTTKQTAKTVVEKTKRVVNGMAAATGRTVYNLMGGQTANAPEDYGIDPEKATVQKRENKNTLARQLVASTQLATPLRGGIKARVIVGGVSGAAGDIGEQKLTDPDKPIDWKRTAYTGGANAIFSAAMPDRGYNPLKEVKSLVSRNKVNPIISAGNTVSPAPSELKFTPEWKTGNKNKMQYDAKRDVPIITLKNNAPEATVWHEVAHAIDRQNPRLRDSLAAEISEITGSRSVTNEDFGNALKIITKNPEQASRVPGLAKIKEQVELPDAIVEKYGITQNDDWIYRDLQNLHKGRTTTKFRTEGMADEADPLIAEARKYKSAEDFIEKGDFTYHGTPYELEGGKLSFGKGKQLKKGGYMGGHFLTNDRDIANTFAFGGEVYRADPAIKSKVLDVNKDKQLFKEFIGKKYKVDGEDVVFTKDDYDFMFPEGERADWSTINADAAEAIARSQGKIGMVVDEYAGGKMGKTYQIFEDNIPVYNKDQLTEIWNKANNRNNGVEIYHGTSAEAASTIERSGFDIKKSADGTIWFTDNKAKIDGGEVAASAKGGIVSRIVDEKKTKLAGWEEYDKYSTDELINMGYDGVKLPGEGETTYQIFNPEKLNLSGDSKPSVTFDDPLARMKGKYLERLEKNQQGVPLRDVFHYKSLYKEYPKAGNIKVTAFRKDLPYDGIYDPKTNTIELNSGLSRLKMREVILRELPDTPAIKGNIQEKPVIQPKTEPSKFATDVKPETIDRLSEGIDVIQGRAKVPKILRDDYDAKTFQLAEEAGIDITQERPAVIRDIKRLIDENVKTEVPIIMNGKVIGRAKNAEIKGNSLLAVHNLSAKNLKFAEKTGGIANPSLAVVDVNKQTIDGFGEISLIARKDMVDPKTARGGKTYPADVYSPRYPSTTTVIPDPQQKILVDSLEPYRKQTGEGYGLLDFDRISESLENSSAMKAKFLKSKGIDVPVVKKADGSVDYYETKSALRKLVDNDDVLRKEFLAYIDRTIADAGGTDHFFAGWTPSGNKRFVQASAENASKLMNKEAQQGGEGMFYGLGNARAKSIRKFNSVDEMRSLKDRIVSTSEFEKIKLEMDDKFMELIEDLRKYDKYPDSNPFTQTDRIGEALSDYMGGGKDAKYFTERFGNIPDELKNKIDAFTKEVREMPTEYFETKYNRPVKIDEFAGAVVPEGTDQSVIETLKNQGVTDIRYYNPNKEGDRLRAVREFEGEKFRVKDDLARVGATITDEQEKQIIAAHKKYFGDDDIRITEQILTPDGQKALGSYREGMIKILDGQADAVDTYMHEAVHKYFDQFTTMEEQVAIMKAGIQKYGIKDLKEVEERLAEDFINYTKNREGFAGTLKAHFDAVFERIKTYFGNEDEIKKLYADIVTGKAKKAPGSRTALPDPNAQFSYEVARMEKDQLVAAIGKDSLTAIQRVTRTKDWDNGLIDADNFPGVRLDELTQQYNNMYGKELTTSELLELAAATPTETELNAMRPRGEAIPKGAKLTEEKAPLPDQENIEGTPYKAKEYKRDTFTTGNYYKGDAESRYGRKINAQEINTTEDIANLGQQVHDEYTKFFQDVKGGRKPNEVTLKQAEDLGWTVEKIKEIPENALLNDAQTAAVAQIKADLVLQLAEATRAFNRTGSEETKGQMKDLLAKIVSTEAVLKRSEVQVGRAAQIKQAVPIPREFDDESLFEVIKKADIGGVADLKEALAASKQLQKATLKDMYWSVYYNAILSGSSTHIKNVTDTGINTILDQSIEALIHPTNLKNQAGAMKRGFAEGLKEAWDILSGNTSYKTKYDLSDKGIQNAVIKKVEYVGKLLAAEDAIWRNTNKQANLASLAYEQARKEGMGRIAATAKVKAYMENPTPEMIDQAVKEALRSTYNQTPEGIVGAMASAWGSATAKAPVLRYIQPFTKVVGNVLNAGIDWTPAGYVSIGTRGMLKSGSKYTSREVSRQVGKATVGTLAMVYAYGLAMDGKITGSGSSNAAERKQMQEQGWQPNSIKIGDKYISYQNLGALGLPLAIVANYADAKKYNKIDDEEGDKRLAYAVFGTMRTITDKSFLSNISQLFQAMQNNDPNYLNRFAANIVTSPYPNALKQIGNYFSKESKDPQTFYEYVKNSMGYPYNKEIQPRLDVFGEPVKDNRSVVGKVIGTNIQSEKTGELPRLLRRLSDNDITLSIPSKNTKVWFEGEEESRTMSDKELRDYRKIYGKNLKAAISKDNEILMRLRGDDLEDEMKAIIEMVRKQSKEDLIDMYK